MAVKISTYIAQTDPTSGSVTINIKVPGSFQTSDFTNPSFSGRNLITLGTWLENRAAGDKITALQIADLDGVLVKAGTVITSILDSGVAAANQGLSLPPNGPFKIVFPTDQLKKTMIPSGLYLVATFQKATVSVDTAVINIAWDDFT